MFVIFPEPTFTLRGNVYSAFQAENGELQTVLFTSILNWLFVFACLVVSFAKYIDTTLK